MDNMINSSVYPYFEKNFDIQYWGEQIVITNRVNAVNTIFSKAESRVLVCVSGDRTVYEISTLIHKLYFPDLDFQTIEQLIEKILYNNFQKGIVNISKNKQRSTDIYGEYGKYYPNYINIEITNICNFNCPHCYKESAQNGNTITPSVMEYILNRFQGKVPYIQFSGGEPFFNRAIIDYINLFSNKFRISIVSNGSMIWSYDVKILKQVDKIQVSLYGSNEQEYIAFTHNKSGYRNVIKSCDYMYANDIEFTAGCTLNKYNKDHVQEIVDFAYRLHAKELRFGVASITGRAVNEISDYLLTREELREAYRDIRRANQKYTGKLYVELWNEGMREKRKNKEIFGSLPCGAGSRVIVVSECGVVRPCEFLPDNIFTMGSIFEYDNYISGEKQFVLRKEDVDEYKKILATNRVSLEEICEVLE